MSKLRAKIHEKLQASGVLLLKDSCGGFQACEDPDVIPLNTVLSHLLFQNELISEILGLRTLGQLGYNCKDEVIVESDHFIRTLLQELDSRKHSRCSSAHILICLIRIYPDLSDGMLERIREGYRAVFPMGDDFIQHQLALLDSADERMIQHLSDAVEQTPFTLEGVEEMAHKYLSNPFFPYDRAAWDKYFATRRVPMHLDPLRYLFLHKQLGLFDWDQ